VLRKRERLGHARTTQRSALKSVERPLRAGLIWIRRGRRSVSGACQGSARLRWPVGRKSLRLVISLW